MSNAANTLDYAAFYANTFDYARYAALRSTDTPAHDALTTARREWRAAQQVEVFDWSDLSIGKSSTCFYDGFTFHARIEDDPNPDYSYVGEFTDTWNVNAVINRASWTCYCGRDEDVYRYFSTPDYTLTERRAGYAKRGMSRHEAYTLARGEVLADMRMMEELSSYGVIVTCSKAGIVLGEDSLWGVDVMGSDSSYFREVARDCAAEALAYAKEALARLGVAC